MPDTNKFWISDTDKEWVHSCFQLLIQAYGYPYRDSDTILFTHAFFPITFANKQIDPSAIIQDLCLLLGIRENKITFEIVDDIRDTQGVPYEIQGHPFECEMEITEKDGGNNYHLFIAKTLLKHPGRLLLNLIIQTLKAKQFENKLPIEDVNEIDLLMYHTAIYLGFGFLLYQNLAEHGNSNDGLFWERKWRFISPMPIPVMAYAMALFYDLKEDKDPVWKNQLKADLKKVYNLASQFISETGNPLFNKQELTARDSFINGQGFYDKNDFNSAVTEFQKALFATEDIYLKADIYNFIGYTYLRIREYDKSILYFQKALEIRPGYGYANDNLGFAFIMNGDLDSGKYYLNIALQTKENDLAYSHRNFALYYQARKEYELADEYFQKAFDSIVIPVDGLEFFYAKFLLEKGEKEGGIEYLIKAVEKGEPEAINLMKDLNNKIK